MKRILIAGLLFLSSATFLRAQDSVRCDARERGERACLTHMLDVYLKALVVHKPELLPRTDDFRFTEDGLEKKLGEGLWKTFTKFRGEPTAVFVDVRQGVVGAFDVVEESGTPALLVIRIKAVNGKYSEVETMVTRGQKEGMIFNVGSVMSGGRMSITPPKAQLHSREDAIRIVEHYPQGLKAGSFVTVDAPFAADAYRYENGQLMAGPGCTFISGCDNIKTQQIPKLSGLTYRVEAVDEELGIVWLRQDFGAGSTTPGNSLIAWEAFKVYGGQIHAVEAFMKVMPAGSKPGWD